MFLQSTGKDKEEKSNDKKRSFALVHSHRFIWQSDMQNLETKLLGHLCGRRYIPSLGCTRRMVYYLLQFLQGNHLSTMRRFHHLWKCSKNCGCGAQGRGLMMDVVVVLGWWLTILKVFNNSMILRYPGAQIMLPEFQDSLFCNGAVVGTQQLHCQEETLWSEVRKFLPYLPVSYLWI